MNGRFSNLVSVGKVPGHGWNYIFFGDVNRPR